MLFTLQCYISAANKNKCVIFHAFAVVSHFKIVFFCVCKFTNIIFLTSIFIHIIFENMTFTLNSIFYSEFCFQRAVSSVFMSLQTNAIACLLLLLLA